MMLLLSAAILLIVQAAEVDVTVPTGAKVVLTVEGRGVQKYVCTRHGVAFEWVFQSPQAMLFNEQDQPIGKHSAGPTWTFNDGGTVTGKVLEKKASPDPLSVPWLLLAGSGTYGPKAIPIDFVRRFDTHFGQPPADGCDADHSTATTDVPYSAMYEFYTKGK